MRLEKTCAIFITIMAAAISLTRCQKADDSTKESSIPTEQMTEESNAAETAEEPAQQENTSFFPKEILDSPEYQACAEWKRFREAYDTDGMILSEIGNDIVNLGEEYEAYGCYSQEMADKVDELCEKYGLSKLNGFQFAETYSDLCSRAGIGDICANSSENVKQDVLGGYLYTDGTFHLEGSVSLAGSSLYTTDYQLMRAMKGSLNTIAFDFGEAADYSVREYTTAKGETVLLASGSTRALILAERDKSFVRVRVLGDITSDIFFVNDEMMETLADAFDFAAIP